MAGELVLVPEKDTPVILTVLAEPKTVFSGRFLTLTGRIMVVFAPNGAGIGQPIQIEAPNMLWLGEVHDCEASAEGVALSIDITHVLDDLAELARLSERFTGRSVSQRHPNPISALTN